MIAYSTLPLRLLLTCLLLASQCCQAAQQQGHTSLVSEQKVEAPSFPESYQVSYNYTLPYTAKVQPHAISYPVTFWRDHHHRRIRLDTYQGINSLIHKKGFDYVVSPRIDKQRCYVYDTNDGPTGNGEGSLREALPDVRGWEYTGVESLGGREAHTWLLEQRREGKQLRYTFYSTASGTPLRLHMHGKELFDGSHFDEWIADYTDYKPGSPDPDIFATPALCEGQKPEVQPRSAAGRSLRLRSLAPEVRYGGDAEYDAFLASRGTGRAVRSLTEYRLRAEVYRTNARLIEEHNRAGNRNFTLRMNRFGDWTKEEFLAIMLPKHGRPRSNDMEHKWQYELPHRPLTNPDRVPKAVDWRGTGADGKVKDQASCGSCWAFATAGALEAAWFRATGQQASFSEQQIMDCSWDYGANKACDGGDTDGAIEYVAASGGVAITDEYEYLGQDAYCRDKAARRVGKFKGFARTPRYDNKQLMEAIYSRGPMAVSIDASPAGFAFYGGGVFYDPNCKYKPDELDHAVVVVGYGTDEKQGDYWLIKNSWSDMWGDGGYIKISRDNFGCGVPSDAMYAVAEEES